jgi:hypothetical protein
MARLPDLAHAILEIRKLADYCLDSSHPRGRHKARVFRQALGADQSDAHGFATQFLPAFPIAMRSRLNPTNLARAGASMCRWRDKAGRFW